MDPIVQSYWTIHRLPTPLSRADDDLPALPSPTFSTFSRPFSTSSSSSSFSPRRNGHRRSHAVSLSAAPASPAPRPPVEAKAIDRKRRIRFSDEIHIVKPSAPLTPPLQTSDPTDVIDVDLDMGTLTLPSSAILNAGAYPDSPRSSISGASTGLLFEDLPTPDTARSFYTSELDDGRKHLRAASQDLVDQLPTEPALMEDEESVQRWERLVGILRGIELNRQ